MDPNDEEHAWVFPSQLIDNTDVRDHLLATDADFRDIVVTNQAVQAEERIGFGRYPFDESFRSENFGDKDRAMEVAFHHAHQLWEQGLICHWTT